MLLSVFVPVAFIPGISGELFRQFAVTVAVSMFLSAINALTLSPALCGVLLRPHHGPRRGVMGFVMRVDRSRARRLWRSRRPHRSLFASSAWPWSPVAMVGIVGLAKITPTGFLPEDDQGALFVVAQLPGGASVARTTEVVQQAEAILQARKRRSTTITSVIGLNFIDNYSQSNAAFMVVTLKPFEERKDRRAWRGGADRAARRRNFAKSRAARSYRWRRRRSSASAPAAASPMCWRICAAAIPKALAQALRGLMVAANQDPQLNRVFSTFSATNPSIYLDIDRDKAQILGVPLEQRLSGAAGLARRLLRQQHESVRPHLAGAGAGRSGRPVAASTTSTASTCAAKTAR